MNKELTDKIEMCLWHRNLSEIPAIIEPHIGEIDFDDDDDMEKLIDFAVKAAYNEKDTSFIEYLITKGFDLNYKLLGKECLILKLADRATKANIFAKIVELGADVYSENNDGDNVLILAARRTFINTGWNDNPEELVVHIVKNYDLSRLDKADKFGITPLMYAVMHDKRQLVDALIEAGADVNCTGTSAIGGNSYWMHVNGVSPLAVALRCGNAEIVKKLLAAGADENICDTKGNPPIFSLVQFPFNFNRQFSYGNHVIKDKCEVIPLLKNLDLTDGKGYTVLMQSLCDRDNWYMTRDIALALIEKGANVNAVGNDGKRALHYAVDRDTDVVKALVKAGADVNAQDNAGNTALLIACKYGHEKTARYLIRAGADFNIKNNSGESPAELAAAKGLNDVLELMI